MSPKKQQLFISLFLLVALMFGQFSQVSATQEPSSAGQSVLKPEITYDVQHDLSAPLTDLAVAAMDQPETNREVPMMILPKVLNAELKSQEPDSALQDSVTTNNMPDAIANFEGISNIAGVAPPDTNGDVGYDPGTGKKYYMQWVNLHIQAWDVTNPAAPIALFPSPIAGNSIWSGFGGRCESDNDGDPIVLYDELANRWMISQFSVTSAPYYNCIAISQTANPSGAYYRYAFQYSATKMNDYPKYGVWPDGYYMTVNQFTGGSSWGGVGVAVYERAQMLTGGTARQVVFDLNSVNTNFGGMLPADFEGTPPAAGQPAYFAEVDDSSSGLGTVDEMRIWQFHADWVNPANMTFGLSGQPNQVLPVTNFNLICSSTRDCVPQPGTSTKLDAIGDRLMYRLAYRKLDSGTERMVVNHTVDVGSGRAGVRWYQLDMSGGVWAITQQGTYAGDTPATDTTHRWMGSISMDRMGNLALGYSMSSGSVYPSIGLVGRLNTDAANTLPQGEKVVFTGTTSQTGVNRWGDYSSMSIDPQDGCTFWYTQEYSAGSWTWHSRIVSFKYPTCSALPTGMISGTVRDGGGNPIAGVQVMAGIYGAISGADGVYTITLPIGTYSMTATAFGYLPGAASGINVLEGQTTTQNFVLSTATMRKVYGVVSDATPSGHNWPLYAQVSITGYPGGSVFTNPLTGYYEVFLPQGFATTLSVSAVPAGYGTASQVVTVPASDLAVNFGLTVNTVTCVAPGYDLVGGFLENFDGVAATALPTNWAFVQTGGTNTSTLWATHVGTRYPSGYNAVSQPNVAYFNSWSVGSGNAARLYYTLPFNMTTLAPDQVTFQMFHDTGYSTSNDQLQVVVSTNGGATWTGVGSTFSRYATSNGWVSHTVDLSAYSASTSLLIGFNAISAYGNDIHIDDVIVGALPTCAATSGGLLMGNVFDLNSAQDLANAVVQPLGAEPMISGPTANPDLGSGFYYGFIPAGSSVSVSATKVNGYGTVTTSLNVANNSTTWHDFNLPAGHLTATPPSFALSLAMNTTGTQTLTLGNVGTRSVDYSIAEMNLAPNSVPLDPNQDPVTRHLGPKNFNKLNLDGVPYYVLPDRSAPQYPNLAAGDLISSFSSGLTSPWGMGYNQAADTLWVSNLGAGGGDDLDYEFTRAGALTGKEMNTGSWIGTFAADMAYDPVSGTFWQVNVGGDNCIYEMDPVSMGPTGEKICPAFGTSERGLAYDPVTDTFFAGSWNDTLIKRFDRSGLILQQVNVSLPIAGLAYNPMTGHLFVTNNGSATYDINVLDVNANYANLGGINVTALNGGEAGLEISCDGHLWAVNQTTKTVLEIDSGETGVCAYQQIPWLSENPVSGTLAVSGTQGVTLTYDATGLMPGTYEAQLKLVNNTPYHVDNVPVTLTVTQPPTNGTVEGIVNGLGVCDTGPGTPLKNAAVKIYDNAMNEVASLTTDNAGHYLWSGPVSGNVYTVTVSLAGYVDASATISLISSTTSTLGFNLRPILPCVTAEPVSLTATVLLNGSATIPLTLTDIGAAGTNFTITEQGGTTVSPTPQAVVMTEGFESGVVPPSGWSTVVTNASYTWSASTAYVHSGTYGAYVPWNYSQDEWLLSPEYALASGTLSIWSQGSIYWCRDTYNNCDVKVWLVVGTPGGGDDVYVGDLESSWTASWTWAQSTFNLDSLVPGVPVRIGIEVVGNDAADVGIDDISLDGVLGLDVPWLSENPTSGSLAANTGSAVIDVNFDATGLALGTYTANLRITDDNARLVEVPVTLNVVGSMIYLPLVRR